MDSEHLRYEKINSLKVNDWVDAKDVSNTWRLGKIYRMEGDIIMVKFDGWSHKYIEVCALAQPTCLAHPMLLVLLLPLFEGVAMSI